MLEIVEPSSRFGGPILVVDEEGNDVADFFHSDYATVPQSYDEALAYACAFVELVNGRG